MRGPSLVLWGEDGTSHLEKAGAAASVSPVGASGF